MKTLFFALLLITLTVSVNAQSKNSLVFGDAIVKYKKMEIAGTALTAIGTVALFTGNFLYWKTFNDHKSTENQEDKARTNRNIMLGGLGVMAVGIPLWAIGKSKERHITIEAELVKFKGFSSANGIGLRLRF